MPSDPAPIFVVVRPPGSAPYAVTLDRLTEFVRAARIVRTMGFLDKMKQAGQIAADLEAKAEAQADTIIARGAELETKLQAAVLTHTKRLDASYDALDQFQHALDALGNGAPQTGSGASVTPTLKPATPDAQAQSFQSPYEPPFTNHGVTK